MASPGITMAMNDVIKYKIMPLPPHYHRSDICEPEHGYTVAMMIAENGGIPP